MATTVLNLTPVMTEDPIMSFSLIIFSDFFDVAVVVVVDVVDDVVVVAVDDVVVVAVDDVDDVVVVAFVNRNWSFQLLLQTSLAQKLAPRLWVKYFLPNTVTAISYKPLIASLEKTWAWMCTKV